MTCECRDEQLQAVYIYKLSMQLCTSSDTMHTDNAARVINQSQCLHMDRMLPCKVELIVHDHQATFFFFFQAEDGIRDLIVTGVQTCALPIYVVIRPPDFRDSLERQKSEVQSRGDELRRQAGSQIRITGFTIILLCIVVAAASMIDRKSVV